MNYEDRFFARFNFSDRQIEKNLASAIRDLEIAKKVDILDVKFNYAYSALIKGGIALLSHSQLKVKSIPGHQAKIIENLAQILNDDSIETLGNMMRQKRNLDFYSGGVEVTEKGIGAGHRTHAPGIGGHDPNSRELRHVPEFPRP